MLQMMVNHAEGFTEDCSVLLSEFVAYRLPQFHHFCTAWKRSNFQYIFYGHSSDEQLVQFIEDALNIVKKLFVNSTVLLERIGSFYLLYALFFKQPTRQFCKIRLTMQETDTLLKFYADLPAEPEYDEVRLCYWKLIQADALRFVECEHEFGFERWLERDGMQEVASNGRSIRIGHALSGTIATLKEGIVPALQILEAGYNEMKEHLDPSFSRELLPATNIMNDLLAGCQTIDQLLVKKSVPKNQTSNVEKRKLIQQTLETSEGVKNLGYGEWEETQDMPNIGERRSVLKNRSRMFDWTQATGASLDMNTKQLSSFKRNRRTLQERIVQQNLQQNEEALSVNEQEIDLEAGTSSSSK